MLNRSLYLNTKVFDAFLGLVNKTSGRKHCRCFIFHRVWSMFDLSVDEMMALLRISI